MKRSEEGSITVFLSLILLLILAVIMTTVEASRVSVAKTYTERSLITAMDSVLAEYYLPLFQEYHLFGLDGGYGTKSLQEDNIVKKLNEYMEYTYVPEKDLYLYEDYLPITNINLFGIHTTDTKIDNITTLLDFDGELFYNQAVSYMKYKDISNVIDRFRKNSTQVKNTENALTVLEKKQETQESLYEMDEKVLSLMRLADGILISDKGVKLDRQGEIKIQENFIKKICTLPITKENLSLNNELAFSSLNRYYVNPLNLIDGAVGNSRALITNITLKENAWEAYQSLATVDRSSIEDEEALASLYQAIAGAWQQYEYYVNQEEILLKSLNKELNDFNKLIKGTIKTIDETLPIVDDLLKEQIYVTEQITDYENVLTENKAGLDENLYKGLSDDLTEIQKYKKNNTPSQNLSQNPSVGNYDFQLMKTTLITDRTILSSTKDYPKAVVSESYLEELIESLNSTRININGYSHKGLQFDYSTLVKPEESDRFFQSMKNVLQNGLMDLILDTEKLSKKELVADELPSSLNAIAENKEPQDISTNLSNMNLDSKLGSLTELFTNLGSNLDFTGSAVTLGEGLGEAVVFQEYIMEHFTGYNSENLGNAKKTLEYELEYILMGKNTDYKNIKAVVMKLLLVRTVMNLITLIGDTKSSNEAKMLAISFVGYTGLPALVELVKVVILSIWSFNESLIDTAALLQGKKVPFLKESSNLQLKLGEIILMNKVYIKSKVEKMVENSSPTALTYQDYIRLFLFVEEKEKKSYRSMDLIQENLRLNYEDTFYIKNCIFSFRSNSEFQMNRKFVAFPFIRQLVDYQKDNYTFKSVQEYSY